MVTVLCADATPSVLAFERDMFEASPSVHLPSAATGLNALHLLCTTTPDVAVLDTSLPGMGGMEVCRRFREVLPTAPTRIILTTDHPSPEVVKGAGADAVLPRPFSDLQLWTAVNRMLPYGLESYQSA